MPGSADQPLRVAIVGAGPSAFYAADHLLKQPGLTVAVDMFDRLPTPYGLVRFGVAPDHQKIKTVTHSFAEIAAHPRFRFYGCVEFGRDITLEEIRAHYHQVLFATGAQTDRHMGIPGEELRGSHPATSFVAWYNGHPDYRHCQFDLSQERAVVVGVGNVAIDVARILCLTAGELTASDMAPHAVEALSRSRIREVHVLGRRGPAQAAFSTPEIKEFGTLADVDVIMRPEEVALDPLSEAFVDSANDRGLWRKIELIQAYAAREPIGRARRVVFRFLVSPVELLDDGAGAVAGVRVVRNVLKASGSGSLAAEPTDDMETIPAGLVFRSVGYRGVALPGVPFHDRWGVILNERGRVVDPDSQAPVAGEYVTGWIKRGPSGVIGTNKPDSVETVTAMLEDATAGRTFTPTAPEVEAAEKLVRANQPRYLTFEDWQRLDALELEAGGRCGRPRVKFTSVDEMLAALGR